LSSQLKYGNCFNSLLKTKHDPTGKAVYWAFSSTILYEIGTLGGAFTVLQSDAATIIQ